MSAADGSVADTDRESRLRWARAGGALYLVIIACGLFAELAVRGALVVADDAAASAANIRGAEGMFRAGFAADTIMLLADAALAFILYALLKPAGKTLALVAASFRLSQTAVLGVNLLIFYAALLILGDAPYLAGLGGPEREALAALMLDLHAHGYDLGLIFFGAHCVLIGWLLIRSDSFPSLLGYLLIAGGCAYLVGSYTRFLAPDLTGSVAPVYAICLVSELAFGLYLLIRGVRPAPHAQAAGAPV